VTGSISKRLIIAILLMLTPFLLLFWAAWYHHVFAPGSANAAAESSLNSKNICEDNFVNDRLPLCAEITDYCKTAGKQDPACPTWLNATKPYRYFFWISFAVILILFVIGAAILVVTLEPMYLARLNH